MDCKRNPTLEEIDQYAEKELELKRAQKQQQQEWMDQMYQEEIEAFDAAFQKLVDEGIFQKLIIFDLKFSWFFFENEKVSFHQFQMTLNRLTYRKKKCSSLLNSILKRDEEHLMNWMQWNVQNLLHQMIQQSKILKKLILITVN